MRTAAPRITRRYSLPQLPAVFAGDGLTVDAERLPRREAQPLKQHVAPE